MRCSRWIRGHAIPVAQAWGALLVYCAICLGLLMRKVRAYEVDPVNDRIVFEDVSKFYGEILGVNRVNLSIPPGITSLVGPEWVR